MYAINVLQYFKVNNIVNHPLPAETAHSPYAVDAHHSRYLVQYEEYDDEFLKDIRLIKVTTNSQHVNKQHIEPMTYNRQ